jgi:imidazoleglycerol-phosphate dehydratase
MDESLARAAVDISGRPYLVFNAGELPLGCVAEDFFQGFVSTSLITLHLDVLRGRSPHHKIEALFKAASRALREASELDPRASTRIPSTKGVLV